MSAYKKSCEGFAPLYRKIAQYKQDQTGPMCDYLTVADVMTIHDD